MPQGSAPIAEADAGFVRVSTTELRQILADGAESALVDVREEGVYSDIGHILLAVPLPLSWLEFRAPILLPRLSTRIIVTDAGDDRLALRAARRLAEIGYTDIRILEGGLKAWRDAGYEVFTGVHVVSKAFGEFVEHEYGTPHLSAPELKSLMDAGTDLVILDSRPLTEFTVMSIPGGTCCAGAELVYRIHDLVPSPETLVVVNCAGRTRSIIGAQALRNAGLRNKVVALENGTMGWLLAGQSLAHGQTHHAPPPSPAGLEKALASARHLAEQFGIQRIDVETLHRYQAEAGSRSLYLLDVRTREEFEAGHLPGSVWAPGGQLVQGVDEWVATRNARIVLVDGSDGVRATITASWLVQIGWGEVAIYADGLGGPDLETGPAKIRPSIVPPAVETVTADVLAGLLERAAATVLVLDTSLVYRAGHIPGSWFAVRARFEDNATRLPGTGEIVLAAPDPTFGAYAAAELQALTPRRVRLLEGGTAAWKAAGLPLETGETLLLDEPDDVWRAPYQRSRNQEQAFKDYLTWEVDLIGQIARDGTVAWKRYP